jgi:hypothetical protein
MANLILIAPRILVVAAHNFDIDLCRPLKANTVFYVCDSVLGIRFAADKSYNMPLNVSDTLVVFLA